MFLKLLLLFTAVPIIELYLLIKVGEKIGTMNTVALVIVTGIVGASFAKSQGAQIISRIRSALNQGQLPGRDLVQGAMILVGGILLVTPGFLTDIAGLSLLFPPTRKLYTDFTLDYFKKKFQSGRWKYSVYTDSPYNGTGDGKPGHFNGDEDTTYQGEFKEIDE